VIGQFYGIVTHIPTATQRLSVHVSVNITMGAVFSVDRAATHCHVIQQTDNRIYVFYVVRGMSSARQRANEHLIRNVTLVFRGVRPRLRNESLFLAREIRELKLENWV
jgi:hypothetical protein